jgi:triacylglycerol lipase
MGNTHVEYGLWGFPTALGSASSRRRLETMMHFRAPKFLVAAAVAMLALTGTAGPSLAATGDVSPPGANDFSCKPSAAHPYPVILVPGTYETMAKNWAVMSPQLKNAGYCVFSLNYGVVFTVPASGPIEDSAAELGSFVTKVLRATKAKQVDLVGHSQGGMMPRYYIKFLGGTKTVHALVGISPSNHGTTLMPNPLSYVPGVSTGGDGAPSTVAAPATLTAPSLGPVNAAASEQAAGSAFLTKLNAGGDIQGSVLYTTIATTHDEVVTPYQSQALAGPTTQVTNVVIQNFCPLDPIEHDQTPNDPVVLRLVLAALNNANGPLPPSFTPSCL